MLTKDLSETYEGLPENVKSAMLALSILIDRIGSLPKADRDDLFELLQEWRRTDDPEERRNIHRAMDTILAQVPIKARPMPIRPEEMGEMPKGLKALAQHVGGRIREHRERAKLTQVELAERSGLPQSHISRLENGEHSATNMTLEKIAKALGIGIKDLDPCIDEC